MTDEKTGEVLPLRRIRSPDELLPSERTGALVRPNTLPAILEDQHVIHGIFGRVFEAIGGEEHLEDWARENPTAFYQHFVKMAPAPQKQDSIHAIAIQVHASLGPTKLDE